MKLKIFGVVLTGVGLVVSLAQALVSTKMMENDINEAVEKKMAEKNEPEVIEGTAQEVKE